jgi:hypothetical protein
LTGTRAAHKVFFQGSEGAMTAAEMLKELARLGLIVPSGTQAMFEMPTVFETVPTFVTYGTPDFPVALGTGNARLEQRSQGDSRRTNLPNGIGV